ncbi:MAG: M24 family metallopeptidase [Pseudonocardia sp.]
MSCVRRREAVRAQLRESERDALLVTDLVNIRYLTGFTGSNAALLLHVDDDARSVLCTDGRYDTQAAAEVPDLLRLIERDCVLALVGLAAEQGVRRLGFESDAVTVEAHAGLVEAAGTAVLHRAPGLVRQLRMIKDEAEVGVLREACACADQAFADLLAAGGLRPGRTERDVALDLETRMRRHGATGPAFETIVASGAHSAVPHHRPTDAILRRGDLVKLDFGALWDGYHSDMTRTVVLGPPAAWQRELYDLVAAAQVAGRAAALPGADVVAVDAAARTVIVEAGRGDDFPHGLGHGIGLQIHEAPGLGPTGAGVLAAGVTVTVEPGVYLVGRGGVRIEDTVVVRDGEPQLLTHTTRELLEI